MFQPQGWVKRSSSFQNRTFLERQLLMNHLTTLFTIAPTHIARRVVRWAGRCFTAFEWHEGQFVLFASTAFLASSQQLGLVLVILLFPLSARPASGKKNEPNHKNNNTEMGNDERKKKGRRLPWKECLPVFLILLRLLCQLLLLF